MFVRRSALFAAVAVAVAPAFAAQEPVLVPGPYASVSAGVSDFSIDGIDIMGAESLDLSGSNIGAAFGYLVPWGSGAFGVEGHYAEEDADTRRDVTVMDPESGMSSDAVLSIEAERSYGASVLAGGFVRRVLVYGRAGYNWVRLRSSLQGDAVSESGSELIDGFSAGAGVAIPLYRERLSLRLDYQRSFYRDSDVADVDHDRFAVSLTAVFY